MGVGYLCILGITFKTNKRELGPYGGSDGMECYMSSLSDSAHLVGVCGKTFAYMPRNSSRVLLISSIEFVFHELDDTRELDLKSIKDIKKINRRNIFF